MEGARVECEKDNLRDIKEQLPMNDSKEQEDISTSRHTITVNFLFQNYFSCFKIIIIIHEK